MRARPAGLMRRFRRMTRPAGAAAASLAAPLSPISAPSLSCNDSMRRFNVIARWSCRVDRFRNAFLISINGRHLTGNRTFDASWILAIRQHDVNHYLRMDLKEERKNEIALFRFSGRLDATTSHEVYEKCSKIIDTGVRSLVFDCSELSFLSSAGLRTLLLLIKRLKAPAGKVAIFGQKDSVREVLDLSGFSALFSFAAGEEEALALVRK